MTAAARIPTMVHKQIADLFRSSHGNDAVDLAIAEGYVTVIDEQGSKNGQNNGSN
jgi:hypothetical protein